VRWSRGGGGVEDPRGFLECLMQLTKVCGPGIKSLSIHSPPIFAGRDEPEDVLGEGDGQEAGERRT
jgi:hypothetical protein